MIVEMTLDQLIKNTEKIDTTKRHHIVDTVQLRNGFKAMPIGSADVLFTALTSTNHSPKIRIELERNETGTVNVGLTTGETIKVKPADTRQQDVQVTCDCDDFVYRFATVNSRNGVLFGNITKTYISKGVRKPEGPFEPSICKHILKLGEALKNNQIIR